jgi:hypothetical protein
MVVRLKKRSHDDAPAKLKPTIKAVAKLEQHFMRASDDIANRIAISAN